MTRPRRKAKAEAQSTATVRPRASAPGYWSTGTRADEPDAVPMQFRRSSQLEVEAFRWRLRWIRLARHLRSLDARKNPWAVLAKHGLAGNLDEPGKRGKIGRSQRERDRIGDLYTNMVTAPAGPAVYGRTPERLELLWQSLAEGDPVPEEFWFRPDRDVPMPPKDAVRNVAKYLGDKTEKTALRLLREIDSKRADQGRSRLPQLPPKRTRMSRFRA